MKKLFWQIRGHDGFKTIFETTIRLGQLTDAQMKHLLRALTAKASLGNREIVGAYAKRKTKIANMLLDVQKDCRYPTYTCGCSPVFSASVVDEHGRIAQHAEP